MNVAELKALAMKASSGPWEINKDFYAGNHYYISNKDIAHMIYVKEDKGARYANGDFIAAANPQTILRLIAAYEAGLKGSFTIGNYRISQNKHGVWFTAIAGERNGESMTVSEDMMNKIFAEHM